MVSKYSVHQYNQLSLRIPLIYALYFPGFDVSISSLFHLCSSDRTACLKLVRVGLFGARGHCEEFVTMLCVQLHPTVGLGHTGYKRRDRRHVGQRIPGALKLSQCKRFLVSCIMLYPTMRKSMKLIINRNYGKMRRLSEDSPYHFTAMWLVATWYQDECFKTGCKQLDLFLTCLSMGFPMQSCPAVRMTCTQIPGQNQKKCSNKKTLPKSHRLGWGHHGNQRLETTETQACL